MVKGLIKHVKYKILLLFSRILRIFEVYSEIIFLYTYDS